MISQREEVFCEEEAGPSEAVQSLIVSEADTSKVKHAKAKAMQKYYDCMYAIAEHSPNKKCGVAYKFRRQGPAWTELSGVGRG